MMKKIFSFVVCSMVITTVSSGQTFKDLVNKAETQIKGKSSSGSSLSSTEIASGLKQALQVGTQNASKALSQPNGYFGNSLIKIVMPPEAKKVETILRDAGLGKQVDDAIMSMNRAAEDAATQAVPIFVTAIKNMTITDALGILQGGQDAATSYLKSKTTASLITAFKPVISKSLDKVDATKYWHDVFTTYNEMPFVMHKVNPDLVGYVTEQALNGLFVTIAMEEAKIRTNPQARVTDLLKKVFAGH